MDQRLERYDRDRLHHYVLTLQAIKALLSDMALEDHRSRARRPGLEAGRADIIIGGGLVLATVMEQLGFDACLVSESDILDGMVASLQSAA
jgi:exopolyphosphatase/guanosine-5'-triphosphate,3'-diphosphate pyrophosphatase